MELQKKYIILISIVLLLLFLISTSFVVSATNSIGIKGGRIQDLLPESRKAVIPNIPNKLIPINGNTVNLKYKYSINSDKTSVYTDTNNTEYILDDNTIVGFIKETNHIPKEKTISLNSKVKYPENLSKENILSIATNYCFEHVQEFEKYQLVNLDYISSYDEYSITFMKKCNGYKTCDTAEINITPYGEIVSYFSNNQGLLDKYDESKIIINQVQINNFIDKQLNIYYNNVKTYRIEDQVLNVVNGKLSVQCYVTIMLNDDTIASEVIVCYI